MMVSYILGVIVLCFMTEYVVVRKNFRKAHYNSGLKRDVIIVLGYPAKKDGSMSPILRERIKKATKLYDAGIAKTIICTGGAVKNSYVEADVMATALTEMGVEECNIIRERDSKNTYGNLVVANRIMEDKGLKTAVIVTSPWHLRKASSYAVRLGINHTLEKSKIPREYLVLGAGMAYIYVYTQMIINDLEDHKKSNKKKH